MSEEFLNDDTLYSILEQIQQEKPCGSRMSELKSLVGFIAAWERNRCLTLLDNMRSENLNLFADEVLDTLQGRIKDRENLPLTTSVMKKESGRGLT